LLYKYLTKEQKWSLRAEKAFRITSKDGHTYEIQAAGNNNVVRFENGRRKYHFCVVSKYEHPIPVYDLMLAQKLSIEADPRSFLDIAVTRDMTTGDLWDNGKHIDNPDVVPSLTYAERQVQYENGNYANLEREQFNEIERRRNLRTGVLGDLLVHDICLNAVAHYSDGQERGLGFILNADREVVPCFDDPLLVPPLENLTNAEVEDCIVKLVTGVPATISAAVAQVQAHFSYHDLCGIHVLLHPDTDGEWSKRDHYPPWVPGAAVLGIRKVLDVRVPKGRAWYVADAETVGLLVHWYEGNKMGFCIFNLHGVAIYDPDHADQEVQEVQGVTSEEEASQREEAREEAAGRIIQGQGDSQGEG
jgi:hypothetical protein